MSPSEKPAFVEMLARLDIVYEKKPSKVKADEYWLALNDVPLDILRASVSQHIREARTYPRVSDLRSLADAQAPPTPMKALPPHEETGEATYHCAHCLDMGWQLSDEQPIHTHVGNGAIPTVKPCRCSKRNPALQKPRRYANRNTDVRRPW